MRSAIRGIARIAVDSQRQFDRHMTACRIRHIARATSQQISHVRTGIDIVAVIILTVLRGIDGIGHTCPLGIIAGTLDTTGQSAGGIAATDVTHTPSETYRIGCDDARLLAQVRENDAVLFIVTRIEIKRAEIDPSGTAHLLIDVKLCGDALMPDRITGIVDAARNRLITDIDGITASFGDSRTIDGGTLLALIADSRDLTGRTCREGILVILVDTSMELKSDGVARGPTHSHVRLEIDALSGSRRIIIDDHLMSLPIALTRCEDDGTSLFEHRY